MNNNTIVAETSPIVRDLIATIEANGTDSVYIDRDHPWYPNISEPITRPMPEDGNIHRIEWRDQLYTPAGEQISLDDLPAGWWKSATEGIDVFRNCGFVTRLHGDYMHVSHGFYVVDDESVVEGATSLQYVSEVWLQDEQERVGAEYLAAHPELVTGRPAWAQTVEAIIEPDGTAGLSYEADFGSLVLGASAAYKDGECVEEFGPVKYIVSNEERTSPEELRDMAADFLRAAAALEGSEPAQLAALPPVPSSTCETYAWCDFDHDEAPGAAMHIKPHNDGLLRLDFVLDEMTGAPARTYISWADTFDEQFTPDRLDELGELALAFVTARADFKKFTAEVSEPLSLAGSSTSLLSLDDALVIAARFTDLMAAKGAQVTTPEILTMLWGVMNGSSQDNDSVATAGEMFVLQQVAE